MNEDLNLEKKIEPKNAIQKNYFQIIRNFLDPQNVKFSTNCRIFKIDYIASNVPLKIKCNNVN